MSARRRDLDVLATRTGQHAGYTLRYLVGGFGEEGKDKKRVLDAAQAALLECRPLYTAAFERWNESLEDHVVARYTTRGRLIIGLGRETVLESGVTLQHTYGVPVLPGTGLKGLCSHYCHTVWGADDERYKEGGSLHQVMFGTMEQAGMVTFADGWMDPASLRAGSGLLRDVTTPHHREWSKEIGEKVLNVKSPPSDTDDPVPVSWLSVSGAFWIAYKVDVATEDPQRAAFVELVGGLVEQALGTWGVGGKTSAGYGRMVKG